MLFLWVLGLGGAMVSHGQEAGNALRVFKNFLSEFCLGITVDILKVVLQLFIQISVGSLYARVRLEWLVLQMARS